MTQDEECMEEAKMEKKLLDNKEEVVSAGAEEDSKEGKNCSLFAMGQLLFMLCSAAIICI